jgi:translation elongation factor EF-G
MSQPNSKAIEVKDYVDLRIGSQEQSSNQNTALLIEKIDNLGARMDSKIDTLETRMDAKIDALENRMDTFETRMDDRFKSFEQRIDDKISILTQHFNWKFYTTLAFCVPIYLKLFAPDIIAFINS